LKFIDIFSDILGPSSKLQNFKTKTLYANKLLDVKIQSRVASVGGVEYFDRTTDQELKTDDPKQQGTESAGLTGRENLPPANHRRWVPPTLRPQYGLTEEAKNDAIFRKVSIIWKTSTAFAINCVHVQ
jgi:hypothetical protein